MSDTVERAIQILSEAPADAIIKTVMVSDDILLLVAHKGGEFWIYRNGFWEKQA